MIKILTVSSTFLAILAAWPVVAASDRDKDWKQFHHENGNTYYYSYETFGEKMFEGGLIGLATDNPRMWVRLAYRTPIRLANELVDERIYRYEIDCPGFLRKTSEARRIEGAYYYRGREVRKFRRGRWEEFDEYSPLQLVANKACD